MKINKNIEFNLKKEDFSLKKINEFIFKLFLNNSGFVFMLFFVLIATMGSWIIYKYIHKSVWNDNDREIYLQEMSKSGVDFKADAFNGVIKEIEAREARYQNNKKFEVKNIFGTNK
jgi:hypothetical protein